MYCENPWTYGITARGILFLWCVRSLPTDHSDHAGYTVNIKTKEIPCVSAIWFERKVKEAVQNLSETTYPIVSSCSG